jgi:hypothetical protein
MQGPLAWFPRWCWARLRDLREQAEPRSQVNFTRLQPLDDDEIRDLTGWNDDAEIPAFREGWLWFREHRHRSIGMRSHETIGEIYGSPEWGPGERRAFEAGARAAQAVYEVLWSKPHPRG